MFDLFSSISNTVKPMPPRNDLALGPGPGHAASTGRLVSRAGSYFDMLAVPLRVSERRGSVELARCSRYARRGRRLVVDGAQAHRRGRL